MGGGALMTLDFSVGDSGFASIPMPNGIDYRFSQVVALDNDWDETASNYEVRFNRRGYTIDVGPLDRGLYRLILLTGDER